VSLAALGALEEEGGRQLRSILCGCLGVLCIWGASWWFFVSYCVVGGLYSDQSLAAVAKLHLLLGFLLKYNTNCQQDGEHGQRRAYHARSQRFSRWSLSSTSGPRQSRACAAKLTVPRRPRGQRRVLTLTQHNCAEKRVLEALQERFILAAHSLARGVSTTY
jgi:hypothetical protein